MGPDSDSRFDVAIVGGGLVGASLAVALARSNKSVVLIESTLPPASSPSWDERTIAINAASRRILAGLGLWARLEPDAEPILSTHISERGMFGVARFTAEDAGEPALGYNIPLRAIGAVLQQAVQSTGEVRMVCPATVRGLSAGPRQIELQIGGETAESRRKIEASLVVAADGAHSAVRLLLGIGAEQLDYGQVAIVGAVRPERPHRGVAYERFTPDGPIALLPRPQDRCALVWTVPTATTAEILGWNDPEFLLRLQDRFGYRLGRFLEAGRRQGYPLRRVMSDALTAPRVIFAGNAAQALHPVAAQGFNLGLRDAATVAELVAGAADPGATELLAEYAARRRQDREQVASFTDQLVRLFSNAIPGLRSARHLGLLALDVWPAAKQEVLRRNLGFGGVTPELARSGIDILRTGG